MAVRCAVLEKCITRMMVRAVRRGKQISAGGGCFNEEFDAGNWTPIWNVDEWSRGRIGITNLIVKGGHERRRLISTLPLTAYVAASTMEGKANNASHLESTREISEASTTMTETSVISASESLGSLDATESIAWSLTECGIAAENCSWPVHSMIFAIDSIHTALGMDWWISIIACTSLARLILLPANVSAMVNSAKMAQIKPAVEKVVAKMNAEAQGGNHDQALAHQKELAEIWRQYDCHPLKSLIPVIFQAPTFLTFFFALRHMCENVPSFHNGGAFWFTDMAVADPYYISPIVTSATFLIVIEAGAVDGGHNANANTMRWAMRAIGLALVPMTMSLPQGVFVYWTTTNILSLGITKFLKIKSVKQLFGIPNNVVPASGNKSLSSSISEATLYKLDPTRRAPSYAVENEKALSFISKKQSKSTSERKSKKRHGKKKSI